MVYQQKPSDELIKKVDDNLKSLKSFLESRVSKAKKDLNIFPENVKKKKNLEIAKERLSTFNSLVIVCTSLGEQVKLLEKIIEETSLLEEDFLPINKKKTKILN